MQVLFSFFSDHIFSANVYLFTYFHQNDHDLGAKISNVYRKFVQNAIVTIQF